MALDELLARSHALGEDKRVTNLGNAKAQFSALS